MSGFMFTGFSGVVYMYTAPNGKVYIGLTSCESHRKKQWNNTAVAYAGIRINCARKKYHPSLWAYRVLAVVRSFSFSSLTDALSALEVFYIAFFDSTNPKNGYNMSAGGLDSGYNNRAVCCFKNGVCLYTFSSIVSAGSFLGHSERQIGLCCHGMQLSAGGYEWCFKADKERVLFLSQGGNSKVYRKLLQFDLSMNLVRVWNSLSDAARYFKCSPANFYFVCTGRSMHALGYTWCWSDNEQRLSELKYFFSQPNREVVVQYSLDLEELRVWANAAEPARLLHLDESGLSKCLLGKSKSCGGFIWKREFRRYDSVSCR